MAVTIAEPRPHGARRPWRLTSARRTPARVASNTVLVLIGLCFLLPLGWLVLASVDPAATLAVRVPGQVSTENFEAVLSTDRTFRPLWNSVVLSGGCALITVVVAILAAYPLSRYRMRFNKPFLYSVLFGTGLPITPMMVPRATPTRHHRRFIGCSATAKPCIRPDTTSMAKAGAPRARA
jgi:multiple sugar transport system permease protein